MQIDRILYPVKTLGPGNRAVIWTIGCPHRCRNCSNPELWDPAPERDLSVEDIIFFINGIDGDIDGITITGGEPIAQAEELYTLISSLRKEGYEDILVYSGYEYDQIKRNRPELLTVIDVLITGKYIDDLNDNKGIRGSANQIITILNGRLDEKYKRMEKCERVSQNFTVNGLVISVGIPKHM